MIFFKKYFALIFLCCVTANALCCIKTTPTTVYLPKQYQSIEETALLFKDAKPIILWDLHKVLFDQKLSRMFFYHRNNKKHERLQTLWQTIKALFSPSMYQKMYSEFSSGNKIAQAYFESFKKYPDLYKLFLEIANDIHTPNSNVCNILKKMHDQNIQQYIFSNIGPEILIDLQTEYPDIFKNFSYSKNLINQTSPLSGLWIYKPKPESYQKALNFIKNHNNNLHNGIIFIDDKLKNIIAAQKEGILGILFINPQQLENDLKFLNIITN